jgi:hypothetical protein
MIPRDSFVLSRRCDTIDSLLSVESAIVAQSYFAFYPVNPVGRRADEKENRIRIERKSGSS